MHSTPTLQQQQMHRLLFRRAPSVLTPGMLLSSLHTNPPAIHNQRLRCPHAIEVATTTTTAASSTQAPTDSIEGGAQEQQQQPAFSAYIDFRYVRDNLQAVVENCTSRNAEGDPALVASLYAEKVRLEQESDALRAARNENSGKMKGKLDQDTRAALVAAGKALKEQLAQVEEQLVAVEGRLQVEGQKLPNMTHPDVPEGGEDDAVVLREVGSAMTFDFAVRDHLELGSLLDVLDFETGAKVTGTKFYYLRRAGALLELALVNWTMQQLVARGFLPMLTPDIVRESTLEKCGFQPRATNTQVYRIDGGSVCLTGTAEVPLGGVYMDEVLDEAQLPIKMTAYGRCFRTEAGAAGSASKGLYRVHQFSKVEMFIVCTPEQSEALLQELLEIEVDMFTQLGLHFKVLDMAKGDLGAPAYRKFDVEAWMPGMERYGEISSASNCTDYQARRLNIRYRPTPPPNTPSNKKVPTQFVHTLNATACAVPRMIVAILENFQQEDGSVVVPEVLRPYMGGLDVIRPPTSS